MPNVRIVKDVDITYRSKLNAEIIELYLIIGITFFLTILLIVRFYVFYTRKKIVKEIKKKSD